MWFKPVTEKELAAMAAASKGPSLDDVQKAAEALKEGDLDGAAAVFDLLMRVKGRTDAGDDMVVKAVKKALGAGGPDKKSIKGMLKDAELLGCRLSPTPRAATDGERDVHYYAFDLLHLDGWDVSGLQLIERKALLQPLQANKPGLQFNGHETWRR